MDSSPSSLRIATWNINSVRLRLALVERLLSEFAPDVLCLQEIKCRDAEFPTSVLTRAGYRHCAVFGQKGYHGVALVSRLPLHDVRRWPYCGIDDARHISAEIERNGRRVTLHNYYVPAGGDEPDPAINPKFAHKLQFLEEMKARYAADRDTRSATILVGDLNIAPLESDVWSHRQLLRVVSHTPVETESLNALMTGGNWVDAVRTVIPPEQRVYTWWSYRSPSWERADKGRRLDHVWITRDLVEGLRSVEILKPARGWDRPSDHVPVVADIEIG